METPTPHSRCRSTRQTIEPKKKRNNTHETEDSKQQHAKNHGKHDAGQHGENNGTRAPATTPYLEGFHLLAVLSLASTDALHTYL